MDVLQVIYIRKYVPRMSMHIRIEGTSVRDMLSQAQLILAKVVKDQKHWKLLSAEVNGQEIERKFEGSMT
jgi:hypothetical protein